MNQETHLSNISLVEKILKPEARIAARGTLRLVGSFNSPLFRVVFPQRSTLGKP